MVHNLCTNSNASKKKPKKPVDLLQKPVDYSRSISGTQAFAMLLIRVVFLDDSILIVGGLAQW